MEGGTVGLLGNVHLPNKATASISTSQKDLLGVALETLMEMSTWTHQLILFKTGSIRSTELIQNLISLSCTFLPSISWSQVS